MPNISDINKLLNYLEESISSAVDSYGSTNVISDASTNALPFKHDEREMQKLTKRLIPYSQSLQDTATHISYERTKLMAMIPSPIINKLGLWRVFSLSHLQISMIVAFLKLSRVKSVIIVLSFGIREFLR